MYPTLLSLRFLADASGTGVLPAPVQYGLLGVLFAVLAGVFRLVTGIIHDKDLLISKLVDAQNEDRAITNKAMTDTAVTLASVASSSARLVDSVQASQLQTAQTAAALVSAVERLRDERRP